MILVSCFQTAPRPYLHATLLVVMALILSSCFTNTKEDTRLLDSENRNCIYLIEAFSIPLQHCTKAELTDNGANKSFDTLECEPVFLEVPNKERVQVGPIAWMFIELTGIMVPATEKMYKHFSGEADPSVEGLPPLAYACSILVVLFWGMHYILDPKKVSIYRAMILSFRILLVLTFIGSWDNFHGIVIAPIEDLISVFVDNRSQDDLMDASRLLLSLDYGLATFTSEKYMKVVMAAAVGGWAGSGIVYAFTMLLMAAMYIYVAMRVAVTMMTALLARYVLYTIAPIFLLFALFDGTSKMFDGWFEQLVSFILQSITVVLFATIMHGVIIDFYTHFIIPDGGAAVSCGSPDNPGNANCSRGGFNEAALTQVCYEDVVSLRGIIDVLHNFQFKGDDGDEGTIKGQMQRLPLNLTMMFATILMCYLTLQVLDFSVQLSARISGGLVTVGGTYMAGTEVIKAAARVPLTTGVAGLRGGLMGAKNSSGVTEGGLLRGSSATRGARNAMRNVGQREAQGVARAFGREIKGLGFGTKPY